MTRTIINIIRATILDKNINNELWSELVLAMTYVNNSRPRKVLSQKLNLYEALT